jgi:hypothetical protein
MPDVRTSGMAPEELWGVWWQPALLNRPFLIKSHLLSIR